MGVNKNLILKSTNWAGFILSYELCGCQARPFGNS
jgi:hypothetical protein